MPEQATLCAIMKDEAPAILEWTAYHKVFGFDSIVIYDNDSADETPDLLRALADRSEITYVPWPSRPRVARQRAAYAHALEQIRTEWVCFLDADEFLNLRQDDTIGAMLCRYPAHVSAIAMNWRIFGSSGLTRFDETPVTRRFIRCSECGHPLNRHIKTIARRDAITEMHIHRCLLKTGVYVNGIGQETEIERMGFTPTVR